MKAIAIALCQLGTKDVSMASFFGIVAGWIGGLLNGEAAMVQALSTLAALVVLDWVSGIRASKYTTDGAKPLPEIESAKLRRTTDKIIAYAVALAALLLVVREIPAFHDMKPMLITAVVMYFIVVEAWSIFENLERMGVKLPKFISARLKLARKTLDGGN